MRKKHADGSWDMRGGQNRIPKKPGRKGPLKMTPETIRKLDEAFAMDATDEEAACHAEISRETIRLWREKYPHLKTKWERIKHKPTWKARFLVNKALDGEDYEFAMKYLAKKRPDEFGEKKQVTAEISTVNFNFFSLPQVRTAVTQFEDSLKTLIASSYEDTQTNQDIVDVE